MLLFNLCVAYCFLEHEAVDMGLCMALCIVSARNLLHSSVWLGVFLLFLLLVLAKFFCSSVYFHIIFDVNRVEMGITPLSERNHYKDGTGLFWKLKLIYLSFLDVFNNCGQVLFAAHKS